MAGAKVLKIAMFDEVDEGTAILKAAAHRKDAPDQGFWLTLDADGAELTERLVSCGWPARSRGCSTARSNRIRRCPLIRAPTRLGRTAGGRQPHL